MTNQGVNLQKIVNEASEKQLEEVNQELKNIISREYSNKIAAKRCIVSFLRAYARLDKKIFHVKNINQKELGRNFGLVDIGVTKEEAESQEYQTGLIKREKERKEKEISKRKVVGNRELERMEFG